MDNQIFIKRVWLPDGSIISANLVYHDRPVLILESGEEIIDDKSEITYEMTHELVVDETGETKQVVLPKPVRVYLKPQFMIERKYSRSAKEDIQDIYPPSSQGFYGRLVKGKTDAAYIIQNTLDGNNHWLTITDQKTYAIHESHRIKQYEKDVIKLRTFTEHFDELLAAFSPPNPEMVKQDIIGIIDTNELLWEDIYRLSSGSIPTDLVRGSSARDTLNQLVPIADFPENTQDEILAFLFWVAKDKMPPAEISDFTDNLHVVPRFRGYYLYHLRFKMDDLPHPNYLHLVRDAAMGISTTSESVLDEKLRWSPDFLLLRNIEALAPDWQSDIVDMVKTLNASNEIITTPLISKFTNTTKKAQRNRLVIMDLGLRLRAHIRPQSLGLREILYIGSAHRWPHIHLAYSIRLGPKDSRSPHIRGMIMPPSAVEQVERVLPNIIDIEWSTHTLNVQLYSKTLKRWNIREKAIQDSFGKTFSLKQLRNEFGYWKGKTTYIPLKSEARLLDMASTMFFLADIESEAGQKYWKTDENKSKELLTRFRDLGMIKISYWYNWLEHTPALSRIFTYFQGSKSLVCSVTRAILKSVPTSLARIANDGETSIIISRVPTDKRDFIKELIIQGAEDANLDAECKYPTTQGNYTADLFQRLLFPNGTWNSDVTAFLSQIRSLPKEIKNGFSALG